MTALPLAGLDVNLATDDPASRYAGWLLSCLGASPGVDDDIPLAIRGRTSGDAVADWASSGAMALTGRADGPPLVAPGSPATAARGALLAFEALSGLGARRVSLEGHLLLGERAALARLSRRGPFSPGGSFRIIETSDGWAGVSLPRETDLERLPALIERDDVGDPWAAIASWARARPAREVADRAQLLGIAACAATAPAVAAADEQARARGQSFPFHPFLIDGAVARPWTARVAPERRPTALRPKKSIVVDLSSLWAGPLCAHLLGLAGARVIKVESTRRPDGARGGNRPFFDLLHGGHESVALDFSMPEGRGALTALVRAADVVIESSRPRAMQQMSIDPAGFLATSGDRTWIAITAYGRCGPWANRVGFGDDAAAAAGLVALDPETASPMPCGDAIGDPLAGMHAAVAALASILGGGSRLIDVAIREVVGASLPYVPEMSYRSPAARRDGDGGWAIDTAAGPARVADPVAREPAAAAAALGAHTDSVLAELGLR